MGAIQTNQRENETLFASILPEFFDYVKRNSDEVNTIEVARSLDGIYSMPAYFQSGGVEKIVLVPLSLLTKNIDALIADSQAATQSANVAAQAADAAAARITTAIQELTAIHDDVVAATELCSDMTDAANDAKERCDSAYALCVQATADAQSATADCTSITTACTVVYQQCNASKEACDRAAADTREAIATANAAAQQVTDVILDITTEKELAIAAAVNANTAATNVDTLRQQVEADESTRQRQESERQQNESIRQSLESTRQTNEQNRTTTFESDHQTATQDHSAALLDHQTAESDHINADADHNNALEAINGAENVDAELNGMKVTITDRNGVEHTVDLSFDFYNTYESVEAMEDDIENIPKCAMVSIATDDPLDDENACVYQKRSDGTMKFICDLDQKSAEAWNDWLNNKKPEIQSAIETAGNDHIRANDDHIIADSDHTKADNDHTRAEDDHQTAGKDHRASTQAAALATRQAEYAENIGNHPPYLADGTETKPGDVGYVYQWDYANQQYVRGIKISLDYESMTDAEKQELAADVLTHIAFDDMPTQGSDNAVKSGGLYTALGGQSRLIFTTTEEAHAIWNGYTFATTD